MDKRDISCFWFISFISFIPVNFLLLYFDKLKFALKKGRTLIRLLSKLEINSSLILRR
jgi:hypothetical protein